MVDKSTGKQRKMIKIYPADHTWLLHEHAETGLSAAEIIGALVYAEISRREANASQTNAWAGLHAEGHRQKLGK